MVIATNSSIKINFWVYACRIIFNIILGWNRAFFKYFNEKLHINTLYFDETLEGTGQVEDYKLKLPPKKVSQQYEILNNKIAMKKSIVIDFFIANLSMFFTPFKLLKRCYFHLNRFNIILHAYYPLYFLFLSVVLI